MSRQGKDIEQGKREYHIQNYIKQRRNCTYHHYVMKKKEKGINFQEQIHHYQHQQLKEIKKTEVIIELKPVKVKTSKEKPEQKEP